MDSLFLRCREEDDYQRRLADLLADVHHRRELRTIEGTELFVLLQYLRRLHFLARSAYWARAFHFKARVLEGQKLFVG